MAAVVSWQMQVQVASGRRRNEGGSGEKEREEEKEERKEKGKKNKEKRKRNLSRVVSGLKAYELILLSDFCIETYREQNLLIYPILTSMIQT